MRIAHECALYSNKYGKLQYPELNQTHFRLLDHIFLAKKIRDWYIVSITVRIDVGEIFLHIVAAG